MGGTIEASETKRAELVVTSSPAQARLILSKKNEFKIRSSVLDHDSQSEISKSEFRGFFNLAGIALGFFFITTQAKNLLVEGTLVGLHAVYEMFTTFDLFPSWLLLCASSFIAYFYQLLIARNIFSYETIKPVHIFTQLSLFAISIWTIFKMNWVVIPSAFFLSESLILQMKMHSYFVSNREFQLKAKQSKDNDPNDKSVRWPQNVTLWNYLDFLIIPTLVYELEYPRTEKVRWSYIAGKVTTFVGLFSVMHVIVHSYITPVLRDAPTMSVWVAITHLTIPIMVFYMVLFYIVFDVICNACAELTRFADREFYLDWWNSTSFDEFSRKWNRPVHEWLLRHVYLESLRTYKMSQRSATMVTFLFSSIIHELFMGVCMRLARPWLFILQMSQIPLIHFSRRIKLHGTRVGNILFWIGLMLGPPLLTVLYCREYYLLQ